MYRIRLDVPEHFRLPARYAFEELALRIGLPVRFVSSGDRADLLYADRPEECQSSAEAYVPFDPKAYDDQVICAAGGAAGRTLWSTPEGLAHQRLDLIGGVWRLLTLRDEEQIRDKNRDRRGIFVNSALPTERRRVAAEPLVENHADALWAEIVRRQPGLQSALVPRWPGRARFALCVTHDVDAAHLGSSLELLNSFGKGLRRRSRSHLHQGMLGLRFLGRKSKNPLWAFPTWRAWEMERGLRSAFFVYYRPRGVPRDRDDCRSEVDGRGADWIGLRRMAQEGWEFGVHPSIHVRSTPGAFGRAREWLEAKLRCPVQGVRHHFWALDWRNPYATHRQQWSAGFRYDSSIAWRDQAGFRAGTTLPYRPADPHTGHVLDFTVIPCVLQDRNVLYAGVKRPRVDAETAARAARPVLDQVVERGGILVLNWHQETAWDGPEYHGFLQALDLILGGLGDLSGAWLATPSQIQAHWTSRAEQIIPSGESNG